MGIKQENEITMKVNCGISELCKILEDKGFKVCRSIYTEWYIYDTKYFKK